MAETPKRLILVDGKWADESDPTRIVSGSDPAAPEVPLPTPPTATPFVPPGPKPVKPLAPPPAPATAAGEEAPTPTNPLKPLKPTAPPAPATAAGEEVATPTTGTTPTPVPVVIVAAPAPVTVKVTGPEAIPAAGLTAAPAVGARKVDLAAGDFTDLNQDVLGNLSDLIDRMNRSSRTKGPETKPVDHTFFEAREDSDEGVQIYPTPEQRVPESEEFDKDWVSGTRPGGRNPAKAPKEVDWKPTMLPPQREGMPLDRPPVVTSKTPAFDRPIPVIVMGPRPLPVSVEGGAAGGSEPPRAEPEKPGLYSRVSAGVEKATAVAGSVGVGFAKNEAGPALGAALGAATSGLAMLGPYGQAAAIGLQAVGGVAKVAAETISAFVARGRELAPYSGSLAAASATADVRSLQADIREADVLGPKLAEMIDEQSKLEATFREILLPIKEQIIGLLTELIKAIANGIVGTLEGVRDIANSKWFKIGTPGLDALIKRLNDILGGAGAGDGLIDSWLGAGKGLVGPAAMGPPRGAGLGPAQLLRLLGF